MIEIILVSFAVLSLLVFRMNPEPVSAWELFWVLSLSLYLFKNWM